jgi:hypothetical protein
MNSPNPFVITVQPAEYVTLDETAREVYKAPMHPDHLPHAQAMSVVAAFLRAALGNLAQDGTRASLTRNNRVVVSAESDGDAAARGALARLASDLVPQITADKPLHVQIDDIPDHAPTVLRWQPQH